MLIALGAMTTAGGLFLLMWYRTVVSLPVRRQPPFIHPTLFRWGIPTLSLILLALGLFLTASADFRVAFATVAVALLLGFLIVRFDRYSAAMRMIHDRYLRIRGSHPRLEEIEVLFHTAQWRYPSWRHDRLVELVAGKDIESLILVMVVSENGINPISDWELYRSLKSKAARISRKGAV